MDVHGLKCKREKKTFVIVAWVMRNPDKSDNKEMSLNAQLTLSYLSIQFT